MFSRFSAGIPSEKNEYPLEIKPSVSRAAAAGAEGGKKFLRYLKKTGGIPRISRQNGPFIKSKGKEAGKK